MSAPGVVERYLAAIVSHDWDGLRACITDDVVRTGPFGDRYEGREPYVAFIAETMPSLRRYEMRVARVTYAGGLAFAELSETVEVGDELTVTPEVLVFELADDGRIARIDIYIKRSP